MLATGLLVLGILSRVLIHIPNFTPVVALGLFGGVYLKRKQAILLPLLLLAISDVIIGFHNTMFFTWISMILIVMVGFWLKQHKKPGPILLTGIFSAILFFLVTNFGVWLVSGIYPRTLAGLSECFMMAIPFFRTTLASTIIYTLVLFGVYEWMASRIKDTRFASAL